MNYKFWVHSHLHFKACIVHIYIATTNEEETIR